MTGEILLVHTDGRTERIPAENPLKLERLQELVGGYIEVLRVSEDLFAVINEEGRFLDLPINVRYPELRGPVVFARLDDSGEEGPDLAPLTPLQLRILESVEWLNSCMRIVRINE